MLNFDECKAIAEKRAEEYGTEIAKSYEIGNDFVFDVSEQFTGVFPVVIDAETGDIFGLWEYLVKCNLTMDDMRDIA